MTKKIIILCLLVLLCLVSNTNNIKSNQIKVINIDPTSNFFTQKTDKSLIDIIDYQSYLITNGYQKISENDYLVLYCLKKTMGIAIHDKRNNYTWFSNYIKSDTITPKLTTLVQSKIESGVTIEYYDTNSQTITSAELSFTTKKAELVSKYENIDNGFRVDLDFEAVGIKFSVEVKINDDKLIVDIPYQSIEETPVGRLQPKSYYLKSISVFPFLGSENYEINGYSFIPDGSGALIRYNQDISSTAFIKRIYGPDYGMQSVSTLNQHIKQNNLVTLPIYGVNHGYNQAAFLSEITSGYGAAEIHSYPYMYNNLPINTTFFCFLTRDNFIVNFSNNTSLNLITEKPYPNDYSIKYTFLDNENANYVGMANAYRDSLNLEVLEKENNSVNLHLEVIGLDYKPGLFGKRYVNMTKYDETLEIIKDLETGGIGNFQITYIGWNRGGYFNNGAVNPRLTRRLGSRNAFHELNDYIVDNNYNIDYKINPLVSNRFGFLANTIKKVNLSPFETDIRSSLNQKGYYNLPSNFVNPILKRQRRYDSYKINHFNIDNLSDAFSYRHKNNHISREQMIKEIQEQLGLLSDYRISASRANNYLYQFLDNYYDMNYESSKFLYQTDSIPFISILLSGYVNLYMGNINYISDYELINLRMIEYNLYPSFIITKQATHKLRFTNFEYVNSTEYGLWKNQIINTYQTVNDALKNVISSQIISHQYIEYGISETTYSNGVTILVNYTNSDFNSNYGQVSANNYLVVRS